MSFPETMGRFVFYIETINQEEESVSQSEEESTSKTDKTASPKEEEEVS